MRNKILYTVALGLFASLFVGCKDETKDLILANPTDINFEDQAVDRLSFRIPDGPFKAGNAASGTITINVKKNANGTFSGFALSQKTWRSYPWSLSPTFGPSTLDAAKTKAAIDSAIFSVYTTPAPSQTANYLVANATNDDAFITLDKPAVVEHVLVANNTYNFLLATYGSKFSATLDANTQEYSLTGTTVRNINNPNTSTTMYGRFFLPGPGNVNAIRLEGEEIIAKRAAGRVAAEAARAANKGETVAKADSTTAYAALSKGFIKLSVKGFNGSSQTGVVDFWLAVRPKVDVENAAYSFVLNNWNKVALSSLGVVDKLVFNVTSSSPTIAPYFCLDGFRIKK